MWEDLTEKKQNLSWTPKELQHFKGSREMVRLWGQEVPEWLRAGAEDHCPNSTWEVWGTWAGRWRARKAGKPGAQTQGSKEPCRDSSKWGFLSDRKM